MRSGRVVAWVGGSTTLVGVVMFLALAASRGWFGVPARLIAGGLLGLALLVLGCWLHRRPGGHTGALALTATGTAALYLDLGTATAGYNYLPKPVGLLLGLTVAAAGLALAERWRAPLLALGAVLGVGVLMPVLAGNDPPLLVGLVLVPQLAAAPVVLRRRWTSLAMVAAVFPVLYGSVAVCRASSDEVHHVSTLAAVVAVFVVGAALAVLGSWRLPPASTAGRFAAAPVPALAMAAQYGGWRGALLAGLVGLAALLVTLPGQRLGLPSPHRLVRLSGAVVGAVALFQATTLAIGGAALTGVLLGQAFVLTVLAAVAHRRAFLVIGGCYAVAGLGMAVFRDAPAAALATFPAEPYLYLGQSDRAALLTALALSVLVLLLAVAVMVAAARLGLVRADAASAWLWAPAGVIGMYGAAGLTITAALLVVPRQAGFVGGHAVVTISWTLVALMLLARGLDRPALRVAGLVLVVAALAKLLLFDLLALYGLARVAAFVGAGLLMLTAGSHYARLVAQAEVAAPTAQARSRK